MTDPIKQFEDERAAAIESMSKDEELQKKSLDWMMHSDRYKYSYNFSWMGRPIIKYPNDLVVMQELIWQTKPDLIIETGIAHGGSIIFSASMLELLGGDGKVVGIDIDIRKHNRDAIEAHPMFRRISMIEGSSVDSKVLAEVKKHTEGRKKVMVFLDSLHTHDHVFAELQAYSPLVSVDSYLVLPDTFIEYFPKGYCADRPWDVGNNPMTALRSWIADRDDFVIDRATCNKLLITEAFDGYLKRVK